MMNDWSGSFTRNPEVVNAPMLRSNNNGLANVMVDGTEYRVNNNARVRQSNRGISLLMNPKPVGSGELEKNLREPNESVLEGGKLKNPGWDPSHPRLSRDPNWYPGRGKEKAMNILGKVGDVAQTLGEMLPEPE